MGERESDRRIAVFGLAAARLGLTGRRREIAKLYFLGKAGKEVRRHMKVPEGTRKRDLVFLHGRVGTSNRAEFVHRIYEIGGHEGGKR